VANYLDHSVTQAPACLFEEGQGDTPSHLGTPLDHSYYITIPMVLWFLSRRFFDNSANHDALLSNIHITEQDVKDILQALKIGKACGDDGITHHMLKSTSKTICIPSLSLCNLIKTWVYDLKDCLCRPF
jgi:hypothetical protein